MRRVYPLAVLLLLTIIVAALGGCNQDQPGAKSSQTEGTLIVGTTMEINGINVDDYYFGILRGIFTHMGLVKLAADGEFAGDMAESWESADGRTWTFKLRKGLAWHDGTPVTAHDVKFSLEYLPAKLPVYKSHLKLVEAVEAPDKDTVVIKLSTVNPRFLVNLLAVRILPEHVFSRVDEPKTFNDGAAAIGCGPYIFEGFDRGAGVLTFKANEQYYRGAPNIPRVKVRLFKNPDTLYLALRKGEIDLPYFYAAGTDPFYVPPLLKESGIKLDFIDNQGVPNVLFFNNKKPPLDDLRVREALSYAINYEELLRVFAAGYGSVPNAGFVPRGTPGFVQTRTLKFSAEKAETMLDQAGYKDTDNNGIREYGGKPLELELVVRNDLAESVRLAELLKKYFEAVGVGLNIKAVDNTLFRTISDEERSHQILLSRTTAWGMMMWAGLGSGYIDSRNIGWAVVDDPSFHAIVDRMNSAMDRQEYAAAAGELQRFYAEHLPVIPLYWNSLIQPSSARFEGWQVSPMYGYLWDETWFSLRQVKK